MTTSAKGEQSWCVTTLKPYSSSEETRQAAIPSLAARQGMLNMTLDQEEQGKIA
jgi:hypothetical protein